MPQTVLAFDYGTHNIGVAAGQSVTATANELPLLKARDGVPNWSDMAALLSQWQPSLVVVGLPLNMDGSETELAARARKFGNRIHGRFGIAVDMMDERLSTFAARDEATMRGSNYKDDPVDSIAARLILESWFNLNKSLEPK